ncbi:MAG: NAD-dependent deacylase [bacterium]|nr:NAD-dependent deacylase [bacterium]
MNESIIKAAKLIKESKNCIALTGAGISVESGIPDFRSAGGLWEKYNPAIYASIETFNRSPEMVWEMIFDMVGLITDAKPNPAHLALGELEKIGLLKAIVTQNIDNLHQEAGSKNVIEYHGNASMLECLDCEIDYKKEDFEGNLEGKVVPRCKECNEILKPSVIFFGEAIPPMAMRKSETLAEAADLVLVIGTSVLVYPAASIPIIAKQNGASVIEFNIEKTGYYGTVSDLYVDGKAGETLPQVLAEVKSQ